MSLGAGFDGFEENSLPPGFEPRAFQPIPNLYTDYVIMAPHDKYTPTKRKIVKYRVFLNIVHNFMLE